MIHRFDPASGFSPIPLQPPETGGISGATGIARFGNGYIVALQSSRWTLAVLTADLSVERYVHVPVVRDPHGVAVLDGRVHIVSTGTNRIIRLTAAFEFDAVVTGAGRPLVDVDHCNDVCIAGDRLVASRFGPDGKDGLRNGQVYDVVSGAILCEHLHAPHSVHFADGCVHVAESPSGSVYRIVPGLGPVLTAGVGGYARGLWIDDGHMLIGRSRERTISRSRSSPNVERQFADDRERKLFSRVGLYDYNRVRGDVKFWPLPDAGDEIYGIHRLDQTT